MSLAQPHDSHPLRTKAYKALLQLMFRVPPERIHELMMQGLRLLQIASPINRVLAKVVPVNDAILRQELLGTTFDLPLGLAAGFDKNAEAPDVWRAVGFGYCELGTVTASPQGGNPSPRLFRLPKDKAILNRMGFNNKGAAEVAGNLKHRKSRDVIGINIGKTKVVPAEQAVDDYRRSAMLLGNLADYLVVNVSSPNTPGLRDLQAVDSLRPILQAVQSATSSPVLVKIAPDLNDEDIDAVADLAVELGLAGIIATNTTISREGLLTSSKKVESMGAGGVSGAPLTERSLEVLRRLHERVGEQLVLIAVGGIFSPADAWDRIAAGASLLQGYTPLIYGGPDWIRDIHLGLAEQLRAYGYSSLTEAIGCQKPWNLDQDQ